jgi:hypothetical protein
MLHINDKMAAADDDAAESFGQRFGPEAVAMLNAELERRAKIVNDWTDNNPNASNKFHCKGMLPPQMSCEEFERMGYTLHEIIPGQDLRKNNFKITLSGPEDLADVVFYSSRTPKYNLTWQQIQHKARWHTATNPVDLKMKVEKAAAAFYDTIKDCSTTVTYGGAIAIGTNKAESMKYNAAQEIAAHCNGWVGRCNKGCGDWDQDSLDRLGQQDGAFGGLQITKDAKVWEIFARLVTTPGDYPKIEDWEHVVWRIGTEDTTNLNRPSSKKFKQAVFFVIMATGVHSERNIARHIRHAKGRQSRSMGNAKQTTKQLTASVQMEKRSMKGDAPKRYCGFVLSKFPSLEYCGNRVFKQRQWAKSLGNTPVLTLWAIPVVPQPPHRSIRQVTLRRASPK